MIVLWNYVVQFGHGGDFLCSSRREKNYSPSVLHNAPNLEDNLKNCAVLGSRLGSLRTATAQFSSVRIQWRVIQSDKFSGKWLSVGGKRYCAYLIV